MTAKTIQPRLVPVDPATFAVYQAAARKLKSVLGAKAPSAEKIVDHELSNRRALSVAEEYLERHGYPTYRTLLKHTHQMRKPARAVKPAAPSVRNRLADIRPALPRVALTRGGASVAATSRLHGPIPVDPTRN